MSKSQRVGCRPQTEASEKNKLRMFRPHQTLQTSLFLAKEAEESVCEAAPKDLRTVMFEAEYEKTKASMVFHNSRRFY